MASSIICTMARIVTMREAVLENEADPRDGDEDEFPMPREKAEKARSVLGEGPQANIAPRGVFGF
jgi:hypothetical protein